MNSYRMDDYLRIPVSEGTGDPVRNLLTGEAVFCQQVGGFSALAEYIIDTDLFEILYAVSDNGRGNR